jgi:hypothetical protein
MKKKLNRPTKVKPTKKAKAPTRKKRKVETSDGKGVTMSERQKGKGSAIDRPLLVRLAEDRTSYNQMMAELARDGEPATVDVAPRPDPAPDCGQRRPAPTSGQYDGMLGNKRSVEGSRSVDLNASANQTPHDAIEADEERQLLEDGLADPSSPIRTEIARKVGIVKAVVESARDEASEKPASDEYPAVVGPGCTQRNPTGHKRSTTLDPAAHQSPEQILSKKEQQAVDGEETE